MEESIQHFSHAEHPLILNKVAEKDESGDNDEEVICYGCQNLITEKDNYYRCEHSFCNFFLHKKCADLPKEMNHPLHQHPVTLHARPPYKGSFCICNICQRSNWKWFTYNCSLCEFDVDIICTFLHDEGLEFEHEGHPHPLTLQLRSALFYCDACTTKDKDLFYLCTTCPFWIHKSCASLPKTIKLTDHDDLLFLAYSLPLEYRTFNQICDICRQKVQRLSWIYYCDNCRYISHVKCATSSMLRLSTGESEIEAEEEDQEPNQLTQFPLLNESADPISLFVSNSNTTGADQNGSTVLYHHRLHEHPLNILNDTNTLTYGRILCDGCVRSISLPFYSCNQCKFSLHRCCAELPEDLQCPDHPEHSLTVMISRCFDYFKCSFCLRPCNGFLFRCESCNLNLDIGCAYLPSRIKHDSHGHPLVRNRVPRGKCNACPYISSCIRFGCEACNFHLHINCVNFPGALRHMYDKHYIPLTYTPPKDHPSEFICEICEADINPRFWFYHCQDCNQSFHTRCISPADWYSNVKFGGTVNFDNHPQHPLTFIRNSKSKYASLCDQCGNDLNGHPILECAPCRFKLCPPCACKTEGIQFT